MDRKRLLSVILASLSSISSVGAVKAKRNHSNNSKNLISVNQNRSKKTVIKNNKVTKPVKDKKMSSGKESNSLKENKKNENVTKTQGVKNWIKDNPRKFWFGVGNVSGMVALPLAKGILNVVSIPVCAFDDWRSEVRREKMDEEIEECLGIVCRDLREGFSLIKIKAKSQGVDCRFDNDMVFSKYDIKNIFSDIISCLNRRLEERFRNDKSMKVRKVLEVDGFDKLVLRYKNPYSNYEKYINALGERSKAILKEVFADG